MGKKYVSVWDKVAAAVLIIVLVITIFACRSNLTSKCEEIDLCRADVQIMIERKAELIPQLMEVVNMYTEYSTSLIEDVNGAIEKISECFAEGDLNGAYQANSELSDLIYKLEKMVLESNIIDSMPIFVGLMDEIAGSENRVTYAKLQYNRAVAEYNATIERFPYNVLKGRLKFEPIER